MSTKIRSYFTISLLSLSPDGMFHFLITFAVKQGQSLGTVLNILLMMKTSQCLADDMQLYNDKASIIHNFPQSSMMK